MFTFIATIFVGLLAGYLLRNIKALQRLAAPINYTILLLLFFMGISIGGNPTILQNLSTLGLQAAVIALAGTAGSIVLGAVVYKFAFSKKRNP